MAPPQAVRQAYQVELDRDLINDLRSETGGVYGVWYPSFIRTCACPSLIRTSLTHPYSCPPHTPTRAHAMWSSNDSR